MPAKLEIPIFGPKSASAAVKAGVSRIELNATGSYPTGGLTPSVEDLTQLQSLQVPVRVMIRPRGPPSASSSRDFIYSGAELDAMERSILDFKGSDLMKEDRGDGFVLGVLVQGEGQGVAVSVDVERCKRLVDTARPYKVVFHRAFDEIVGCFRGEMNIDGHLETVLQDLVRCGFDGALTSGGPGNAIQNVDVLQRVTDMAKSRIEVIVGGGVRSTNAEELVEKLNLSKEAGWLHSSCLVGAGTEEVDVTEVQSIISKLH